MDKVLIASAEAEIDSYRRKVHFFNCSCTWDQHYPIYSEKQDQQVFVTRGSASVAGLAGLAKHIFVRSVTVINIKVFFVLFILFVIFLLVPYRKQWARNNMQIFFF